jgi:hypothetical protein
MAAAPVMMRLAWAPVVPVALVVPVARAVQEAPGAPARDTRTPAAVAAVPADQTGRAQMVVPPPLAEAEVADREVVALEQSAQILEQARVAITSVAVVVGPEVLLFSPGSLAGPAQTVVVVVVVVVIGLLALYQVPRAASVVMAWSGRPPDRAVEAVEALKEAEQRAVAEQRAETMEQVAAVPADQIRAPLLPERAEPVRKASS